MYLSTFRLLLTDIIHYAFDFPVHLLSVSSICTYVYLPAAALSQSKEDQKIAAFVGEVDTFSEEAYAKGDALREFVEKLVNMHTGPTNHLHVALERALIRVGCRYRVQSHSADVRFAW